MKQLSWPSCQSLADKMLSELPITESEMFAYLVSAYTEGLFACLRRSFSFVTFNSRNVFVSLPLCSEQISILGWFRNSDNCQNDSGNHTYIHTYIHKLYLFSNLRVAKIES